MKLQRSEVRILPDIILEKWLLIWQHLGSELLQEEGVRQGLNFTKFSPKLQEVGLVFGKNTHLFSPVRI